MAIGTLRSLIPGQTWLTDAGTPNILIGYVGQFYLDSLSGKIYQKTSAYVWTVRGSIAAGGGDFVTSVNGQTGDVTLTSTNITEGSNLYFTDSRAKTAAVIDSTSGMELDKAPSVHAAKEYTTNAVASEAAARAAADALLIPLSQKNAPFGVATLDAAGIIPASLVPPNVGAVQSVNTKVGDVALSTADIAEITNLYFTDDRARTAAVVNSTAGLELDKAPSVHAAKEYTNNAVASEAADRTAADALLIPLSQKGVADGVATLDNTGKIPSAQIPATAITSVTVVQTIAERDALFPGEGDFCVVTDTSETFIYDGVAWVELIIGSAVISVNGQTGAVSLSTTNITEGSNLYYTDARAKLATVIDSSAGSETDKAMSVAVAKMYTDDAVDAEKLSRIAADALLIPLSQKGVASGVATLGLDGLVPSSQLPPAPGAPVTSVNTKTGDVDLTTSDIGEGSNLYYTDARAKLATVIDSSAGSETDKAMSVAAAKMYTNDAVEVETLARQAADALLIPLTQKGALGGVATLDPVTGLVPTNQLPPAGSGGTTAIGVPTRGTYDGGLLAFTPTTLISDATDETNLILAKLAPAKPPNLSTKTISLNSQYTAKEAGTNISRTTVTDVIRPQISTVTSFYDGDNGTLSAEIDAAVEGSIVLTTASQAGTYGALVVTADVDYYAGQPGKEGFWRALSAYILPTSDLAYGVHTYQMKHTTTGNTNLLYLYVDNPTTVTISSETKDLSFATTSYVSGVPTLSSGSQIKFDFTINSAVGKFFNATKIADVTGSNVSTLNIAPDVAGYAENAAIAITAATVTVNSSTYSESPSVSIRGYNSKSVAGTLKSVTLGSRIDTVSNETARKTSGSGQYPSSGYGGTFSSSLSLKTVYTEELQMLNGSYQRPAAVNYSGNLPVAGPDYSSGMGVDDRWVTFVHGTSLSNASAFTITISGASGSWSGVETSGIKIYAKVEGATNWIDCNSAYPGVGSPVNNGDPALVFGSSTIYSKRVTFGSTPRSGILYVRIGLPSGSDKKFTSVSIGSIS